MPLPHHSQASAAKPEATPPASFPRSDVVLTGVAGAVVVAVGWWAAAGTGAPVILALVLTIAVLPVGRWARRRGWPAVLATLPQYAEAPGDLVEAARRELARSEPPRPERTRECTC